MSRRYRVSIPTRKKTSARARPIASLAPQKRSTKPTKIMTPVAKPRLTERYLMSGLGMK